MANMPSYLISYIVISIIVWIAITILFKEIFVSNYDSSDNYDESIYNAVTDERFQFLTNGGLRICTLLFFPGFIMFVFVIKIALKIALKGYTKSYSEKLKAFMNSFKETDEYVSNYIMDMESLIKTVTERSKSVVFKDPNAVADLIKIRQNIDVYIDENSEMVELMTLTYENAKSIEGTKAFGQSVNESKSIKITESFFGQSFKFNFSGNIDLDDLKEFVDKKIETLNKTKERLVDIKENAFKAIDNIPVTSQCMSGIKEIAAK